MAKLLVDDRDQKFVLFEQLDIGNYAESELYSEFDEDMYRMVLSEAEKLATNAMMPSNFISDSQGCRLKDGKVILPDCYRELWRLWNDGEWRRIDLPRKIGGQGLPVVIGMAANEYFEAGNLAFQTLAAMARGVALLIATHGTEEQREKYVEKILSGQWTGTMVLTEAGAGSDVGATNTTAIHNEDGTYGISGTKTFITAGDNNLAENVIHLALARVKGAPAGTKGLSLFIIPKNRINPDGSLSENNDVKIISLENKMGLKGSPTCQIIFGEDGNCVGELIGEENRGMPVFFTMMNESRLIAARHGAAVASAAYLHALSYSKERLQGRETGAPPEAPQIPIIGHPDVRRMLLMMKAYTEGVRALILYTAYCMDREAMAKNNMEARRWSALTAFLTPVAKAYGSDLSFRVTETAMQVYGGYGYMKDYPVEQFLRDEKVHSIYEGTNGIQALDLAARKLSRDRDILFETLFKDIKEFCRKTKGHEVLGSYTGMLEKSMDALSNVTNHLAALRTKDPNGVALYASPYMDLFGDVVTGWLLLWQATIASEKLEKIIAEMGLKDKDKINEFISGNSEAAFYSGKLSSARYFSGAMLTHAEAKAVVIKNNDRVAIEMAEESF